MHDRLQLLRRHREPLLDCRRIEVCEDQLLREKDADDRPDRIHRLREVEPPDGRLGVAEREHTGVGRRLEDRTPARHDEDADEVEVKALLHAGGNVEKCPADVDAKSQQNSDAEGELLDEDRREERQHRICAVERDLHEDSP